VVFATILFALKTGLSLGGAIAGWLLSGYGYQPNTTQTEHALMGIRLTVSVYPAIFLVVVVVCLVRYRITRAVGAQMARELDERRRGYGAGVSAPGLPDRGGAVVATN
jgi:Na+/melibiose symporter-like transporter